MPIQHESAICLRHYDFSETSQVVHVFCEHSGLLHLLAKGSKRPKSPFDGGVDVLDLGTASFSLGRGALGEGAGKASFAESGPPMGAMTAWYLEQPRRQMRRSLPTLSAGLYTLELVGSMVEQHQPMPELFASLAGCLAELDLVAADGGSMHRCVSILLHFVQSMLAMTGYSPQVEICVGTQLPLRPGEPVWFSPRAGGMLSRDAESAYHDKLRLDADTFNAFMGRPATPSAQFVALGLLHEHAEFCIGRELRSWPSVRRLLNTA